MVHWWWTGVLCEPLDIDMKVANDSFVQPWKYNCSQQNKYCYQQYFITLQTLHPRSVRENQGHWSILWEICGKKNIKKISTNHLETNPFKSFGCEFKRLLTLVNENPSESFFKFWEFHKIFWKLLRTSEHYIRKIPK